MIIIMVIIIITMIIIVIVIIIIIMMPWHYSCGWRGTSTVMAGHGTDTIITLAIAMVQATV